MWVPIKNRLFHWKNKCKAATKKRKNLQDQLRYHRHRAEQLEAENERLRQLCQPAQLANHHYPLQMISLAVFIVVQGGSLRLAAAVAEFLALLMGWSFGRPAHTSVRNWVGRCGLYKLTKTQQRSTQMVGIIDESIQIGGEKLLLLLGVPLAKDRSHNAALCGKDVEVLSMQVRPGWTGQDVARFIRQFLSTAPQISLSYFISDRGTSLLAALKQVDMPKVSDCTHHMMNLVKHIFSDDPALSYFCNRLGRLRQSLLLTNWGVLLPPTLRDKDRFLRIFTLVEWTRRMERYWDNLDQGARQHIRFYRYEPDLIRRLTQVRDVVAMTAKLCSDIIEKVPLVDIKTKQV